LSYRPARLHSLAELVPRNRFLGPLKVEKFGIWTVILRSYQRPQFRTLKYGALAVRDNRKTEIKYLLREFKLKFMCEELILHC
jgi:hypothetical protein